MHTSTDSPELVPQFILRQAARDQSDGRFPAAALFVDLSGFSAVTSALMSHGSEAAELMANIMEAIFAPLVNAVYEQEGFITTFAGDAFTALFPVTGDDAELACRRALATAVTIRDHLAAHPVHETARGRFPFTARLGLGLGQVAWGVLRPDEKAAAGGGDVANGEVKAAYYFTGSAIDAAVQAEKEAQSGFVVLGPDFLTAVATQVKTLPIGGAGGARLLAVTGDLPAPLPPTEPAGIESQREFIPAAVWERAGGGDFRQVISVFVNLMGIDSSEQLAYFMTSLFELQAQYGGYLNRVDFGDKGCNLLLFWGTPTGRENDLERALSFLLELPGLTPAAFRAGVTYRPMYTGLAGSARRAEFTCYGDGVNLAARLMMAAPWNEIWLDETAVRRAERAFVLEDRGEQPFKGFAEPIAIRALVERQEAGEEAFFQGEMVGREREKEQLLSFLQPLLAEQPGQWAGITAVVGEAGLGKSRLVYELVNDPAAREKVKTFVGQTDQILRQPFNPFRYWLRRYFEQSPAQSETRNKRAFNHRLDRLIAAVTDPDLQKELNRLRSILGALVDLYWENSLYAELDPQSRHENSLIALQKLFYAEACRHSVLFVLEDAHWLDDASREALAELSRNLTGVPFALLATARPTAEADWPLAGLPHETLTLASLSDGALAALSTTVLGGPPGDKLSHLLAARAEGNPFFAEQILRYLQENETLVEAEGQWELAVGADKIALPGDLRQLFIARLDRLAGEVKEAVQTAAVLGREFETRVLAQMLRDEARTAAYLAQAENEAVWVALNQIRYIFKHGLLRDAAYEMQLVARRRELHRLAAETLETLYADDLAPHYAEIAYHYETAHRQGIAELQETAARYLRLAGDQAAERYENQAALDFLSRALALTGEEGEQIELLLAREDVCHFLAEREGQTADLARLTELAQSRRRPGEEAAVALRRARHAQAVSDYETAKSVAETAIGLAQAAGDLLLESQAQLTYGRACEEQGDFETALLYGQQALPLAQAAGNQAKATNALLSLGSVTVAQGNYDQARAYLEQALALLGPADRRQKSRILIALGNVYYYTGDYATANEYNQQVITINQVIGDRRTEASVLNNMAMTMKEQGHYDVAAAQHEQCLAICRAIGYRYGEGVILSNLGICNGARGSYEEAQRNLENALTLSRELGSPQREANALDNLSSLMNALGNYEQGQRYSQAALTICREIGDRRIEGYALADLAAATYPQGHYQKAQDYCEQALANARELGARVAEGERLQLYGDILLASQDLPGTAAVLLEALAVSEEVDDQNLLLRVQGTLARLHLAQGDIEQARQRIEPFLHALGQTNRLSEPFQLYLTAYETLRAAQDPRARSVLEQAYNELQARAGRISDEETRRSFLENVVWNRQIVAAWEEAQGATAVPPTPQLAPEPTEPPEPVTLNIPPPEETTGETTTANIALPLSPDGQLAPVVIHIHGGSVTINVYYGAKPPERQESDDQS
jgi:predicted ATPase/class 3 adenylate cyclase